MRTTIEGIGFILTLSLLAQLMPWAYSEPVRAAQTYTQEDLGIQAEQYLATLFENTEGRILFQASGIDSRLASHRCTTPLSLSLTTQTLPDRQATIQIECLDVGADWRQYMTVRIEHFRQVVVTTQSLNSGHILREEDLEYKEMSTQQVRDSAFTDKALLLGAKVKRRISSQQPIHAHQTCFVCRGDDVKILSKVANLSIEAKGIARSDALLGERVVVKNSRSLKDLQGVVTDIGEVTVN